MVTAGTSSRSRGAFRPGFYNFVVPLSNERAQGMPGARCTRGLVCQKLRNWRTRAYRAAVNTPTSPAQWLYGLLRALPGGASLLSPSPLRSELPRSFSPAYAAPEPHDLTVRSRPIRLWITASIASRAQRVVTMAIRPSCGHETVLYIVLIFRICKRKIYVPDWATQISLRLLGKSDFRPSGLALAFALLCSF
jgi:hypothetical protein